MGPFERGGLTTSPEDGNGYRVRNVVFLFFIASVTIIRLVGRLCIILSFKASLPEYYTVLTDTHRRFEGSHCPQLQTQNSPIRTQLH